LDGRGGQPERRGLVRAGANRGCRNDSARHRARSGVSCIPTDTVPAASATVSSHSGGPDGGRTRPLGVQRAQRDVRFILHERRPSMRHQERLRPLVGVLVAVMAVSLAAAGSDETVDTYTGCFNPQKATISKFAIGDLPSAPCTGSEVVIHLSG